MYFKHIDDLVEKSPTLPDFEDKKMAFYSVGCCWWTTFPEDLGNTGKFNPQKIKILNPNDPDPAKFYQADFSLPCCPHCGSLLMQAPLDKFIDEAKENAEFYGKYGLDTLIEAHSKITMNCDSGAGWDFYTHRIEMRFNPLEPPTYA
ncbi:MAG: hypothetical protein QMD04_10620 [Anaerolineales bacterium]|nr:hypothetical protein [Anaerolineales bacterium]